MNKLALSLPRLLVLGLGILALFACHTTPTQETEETFTFLTLKEKITGADHLNITLKDTADKVIDVLYNGPVDSSTSFDNLSAKHYAGGKVFIDIEARKGGTILYSVKRTFDAAQGGILDQVVNVSPDMEVILAWPPPRVREGETTPLPAVTVLPDDLADKSIEWASRDPKVLVVEGANLKGVVPGRAVLVAMLKSDPLRRDSVTLEVGPKDAPTRILDALRIEPDALTLAVKGPSHRLQVSVAPTGAPDSVLWFSLAVSVATVDATGLVNPVGEGQASILAVSKADPTYADTILVKVLPEPKVDIVPPIAPGPVYLSKLRYGQLDSESVRRLQVVLGVTPVTGNYKELTDAAVRAEQARAGYTPDPIKQSFVGPKQAARIFSSEYTILP